jgi:hypothetical protein
VLRALAVPRVDTFDSALWRLTRFGVMALVFAEPLVVLGHALRLGIWAMPTCWRMYWSRA